MNTRQLKGWLFDIDELGTEVVLWVYDNTRRLHRLTHEFHPPVYVEGDSAILLRLGRELEKRRFIAGFQWTEKREFWSNETRQVLELTVADSSLLPKLRTLAASREKEFTVYNVDLNTPQYYFYTNRLFPLCQLEAVIDEGNRVREIRARSDPFEVQTTLPPLRVMKMWSEKTQPFDSKSRIILECEDESIQIRLDDDRRAIREFNFFVGRHDPDIILSKRGDTLLFPALFRIANKQRRKLLADRDEVITNRTIITEGRTFTSYGRVMYRGAAYPLRGRWHIDTRNSFFHKETGIDGIVELSRLAKIPVQRMAWQSPGTAMTSIQLDLAVSEDILINWHKSEPERYKTALELLTVDKGGFTFQPPVGAFEDVAEIDFASMYPTIMARHNISPETVLCSCCRNQKVPEALYNVCERRRGLISRALEPLIERRRLYKQLMKKCGDEELRRIYDNRRTSIKWMLVSCFGYLGYKNARFGRIEAHEAVTAFGREKLLKAKEIAETRGFRVLHALTDSLWIQKPAQIRTEIIELCDEIKEKTGIEMSLEGVYRWIVFPPSKQNALRPVATRYYGVFSDGELKVRGLACRRSDTPQYIKEVQLEILLILKKAENLKNRLELKDEIQRTVERRIKQLESGQVEPHLLTLKRTLTRAVGEYRSQTRTAAAAKQIQDAGIKVHPGESVRYVIADGRTKSEPKKVRAYPLNAYVAYDAGSYIEMLKDAVREVFPLD